MRSFIRRLAAGAGARKASGPLEGAPKANGPVEGARANADVPYRTPRHLEVHPTALRRVLVTGSCLAEGLVQHIPRASPGCPADYVVFNNVAELSEAPPRPTEGYDFQLLQLPLRSVWSEFAYLKTPYDDPAAWEKMFADARERLVQLLDAGMRWNRAHGLLTFVTNFFVPQQNGIGRLLPRYDLRNPVYFVEQLNRALHEALAEYANAYVVDMDGIAATAGRRYVQDDVLWVTSHAALLSDYDFDHDQARITPTRRASELYGLRTGEFLQDLWAEVVAQYRTVRQLDAVKLVVVDLDDTLWRGVFAEGAQDVAQAIEGWPLGVVEALCFLKKRGVLLGIVSKNEESRVVGFWDDLMLGRLALSDFAVRRIGWSPKAESLEAAIREVNLLPRNVVYIDDNPVERESIRAALPDVRVLGANPYEVRRVLLWAPEAQVAAITAESARRTEMIQAQAERETVRRRLSRDEFLATLDLKVAFSRLRSTDHRSFPRAFELLNKTNQFNTTGRRWKQEECRAAFEAGTTWHTFEVEDRFSRYGLVGVVIANGACIEQMVMSCRVIGLDVELAALSHVLAELRAGGAERATARFVETDVNLLCRDLFARCGFERSGDGWSRALAPASAAPKHVRLVGA